MYKNLHSGFSLVETLVAITILLLVIIGPLTISSSSVRGTAFASEQVTAFFLAQEGAELMQMARDEFTLEHLSNPTLYPTPWANFSNVNGALGFCYTANGCNVSIDASIPRNLYVRSCSGQDGCLLYIDTTSTVSRARFNASNTGTKTAFTRTIRLQPVSLSEVSVVSTVIWRSGFSKDEQQVSVQTSLFNVYGTN